MMDEATRALIREGIQAEVRNQVEAGHAKISLDHRHLRDIIASGRSNFVVEIRKKILETGRFQGGIRQ